MEIRYQSNRLDGLWWKIGLMAGIISIMASEIYGGRIGGIFGDLLSMWPF